MDGINWISPQQCRNVGEVCSVNRNGVSNSTPLHKSSQDIFPLEAVNQAEPNDVVQITLLNIGDTELDYLDSSCDPDEKFAVIAEEDRERNNNMKGNERNPTEIRLTIGGESKPVLGSGTFGIVYKVIKATSDSVETPICIKQAKSHNRLDGTKYLENEWKILQKCRNELIIRCEGLYISDRGSYAFLFLEYFPGKSIAQMIAPSENGETRPVKRSNVIKILHDLMRALVYLHSLGIIHYDVKPDNILFSENLWQLKLIDFGLAVANQKQNSKIQVPCKGTLIYMAPEVMFENVSGPLSDVYSAGATVYHMIILKKPFSSVVESNENGHVRNFRISRKIKTEGTRLLQKHLEENKPSNMVDITATVIKMISHQYHERPEPEAIITEIQQYEHSQYPEYPPEAPFYGNERSDPSSYIPNVDVLQQPTVIETGGVTEMVQRHDNQQAIQEQSFSKQPAGNGVVQVEGDDEESVILDEEVE